MPILQIRIGGGGGGGGDATAANQLLQLGQDATAANQLNQLLSVQIDNSYQIQEITGINLPQLKSNIAVFISGLSGTINIVNIVTIGSDPTTDCGVIIIYK